MEPTPAYLQGKAGRGRGRGGPSHQQNNAPGNQGSNYGQRNNRGPNGSPTKENAWRQNSRAGHGSPTKSPKKSHSNNELSAQAKFHAAKAEHQESIQRHLGSNDDQYESSDEEEMDDENIMSQLVKSYTGSIGSSEPANLGRTEEYLMNSVKSKANVCLVCIETIKRNDPIWSCECCHTMMHISCIQKWVKDGVYQQTALSDENFPERDIPWFCPKCRYEYKQAECPTRYMCFCGKEEDPKFDPWLVPHSCGQMCGKKLKPECGHSCLLLCHPGPCPPCPQTVRQTCYCKRQPAQIMRCGAQEWSCGQVCDKQLLCGHHTCKLPCHKDECPLCPETSDQPCLCGNETSNRPCADPKWQCQKVCGLELSCGNHVCERVCHDGDCGACPRSGKRSCPCGKTTFEIPCTEDVPTCVDTCGKLLDCGQHYCTQRCHTGPCGTCREMTVKKCRCGKKKKEIQSYKDYLCDTKCSIMKDCRKHPCKRKCCDGSCPPCELQCGKTLGCRNHKCSSRCHRGPCYPCPLTVTVSCSCGATKITLPCGREKITKPPRCNAKCKAPPNCHHPSRIPHRCHFGSCPPCRIVCDKTLPNCSHQCPAPCHTAVLTKVQEKVRRAGPWEAKPEARLEIQERPCPPCQVPMPVTCLGGHETVKFPCAIAKVASCHRPCGRTLACGNHTCTLECHSITGAPDEQTCGSSCQTCEEACERSRPEGCSHPCLLPCHPDDCPSCEQMIRMRCHCSLVLRHIECDQWTHAEDLERDRLRSCGSRCPKTLKCGHQCSSLCHPSPCPTSERCVEKVKVRCPCKRKKREFLCNEVQTGYGKVECDEQCEKVKDNKRREKQEAEKAKEEEERLKRQQELEEFERKQKGRKRRRRRSRTEEEEPSFLQKYGKYIIGPMIPVILAFFIYYLFMA